MRTILQERDASLYAALLKNHPEPVNESVIANLDALLTLARDNPLVNACVQQWQAHQMDFVTMLCVCVQELARVNTELTAELVRAKEREMPAPR